VIPCVNVWIDDDGRKYQIPEPVHVATKFRRDGWPDQRAKNEIFNIWLAEMRAGGELEHYANALKPVQGINAHHEGA